MSVKDPFNYTDRWDSVGLRCTKCKFSSIVNGWPDINKTFKCNKYNLSLKLELDDKGFCEGEWFCKAFKNDGSANKDALNCFNKVHDQLENDVLYGCYGKKGILKEIPFSDIKLKTEK